MADVVNTLVVFPGKRHYTAHWLNESDGTGESAVIKLNVSDLTGPDGSSPSYVSILSIEYSVWGINYVTLYYDATTDDEAVVLKGTGLIDFWPMGGQVDPQTTGTTGDIKLTTDGATDGGGYSILITFRLHD